MYLVILQNNLIEFKDFFREINFTKIFGIKFAAAG